MSGDFELTSDELRAVSRYVLGCAEPLLPRFHTVHPDDPRPSAALEAARQFVQGAARGRLQRVAAMNAHRAATSASTTAAALAAKAAGDAASAAYLHPIAKAHQVGHILRAAACAARVAELESEHPEAAARSIEQARQRAGAVVVDVLCRYPRLSPGRNRVEELMVDLDGQLR